MGHQPRRTEVLRLVAQRLDQRLDDQRLADHRGEVLLAVALESPGVQETFDDEVDLVGALLLRWHTRLTAELDQALGHESRDPALAAEQGWARSYEALPGTRMLLDQLLAAAPSARLERLLQRASATEHARLALAAGFAAGGGDAVNQVGRTLQGRARARLEQDAEERERVLTPTARPEAMRSPAHAAPASTPPQATSPGASARFVERLRALVPA